MGYLFLQDRPFSGKHNGLPLLIIIDVAIVFSTSFFSPLAAIAIALAVALLALIYIPRLGYIYFLLLWLPFEDLIISQAGPYEFYRLTALILLLGLAWMRFLLSTLSIRLPPKKIFLPIAAIFAWSIISTLHSPAPLTSLLAYLRLVTYLAMFLLVYNLIKSERDFRHLLYAAILALLPNLLAAIYQSHHLGIVRASGFIHNPNILSMYSVFAASVSLLLLRKWHPSKGNILFFMITFGISLVALLSSGARASLLSFMMLILTYLAFGRHYKIMALVFIVISIGAYYIFIHSAILSYFAQAYRLYSGSTGRTLLWKSALPMILDNPVWGVGFGTVGNVFQNYVQATHPILGHHLKGVVESGLLHNGFIQKAAETGLVGLVLYLWANFNFFVYLKKRIVSASNPFIANACLAGFAFMLSRMAYMLVESAVHFGPLTTHAGMMVILTGILKVADSDKSASPKSL
jgi:O-antigen ligase